MTQRDGDYTKKNMWRKKNIDRTASIKSTRLGLCVCVCGCDRREKLAINMAGVNMHANGANKSNHRLICIERIVGKRMYLWSMDIIWFIHVVVERLAV